MFERNQKFIDKQGSFNFEAAIAAGRAARAQGLPEGFGIARDAAVLLVSRAQSAFARPLARAFQSKLSQSRSA